MGGNDYKVQVSWANGASNGFPINGAKVEIQNPADATENGWHDVTTLCDQYNNPTLNGWLNSGTQACSLNLYTLFTGVYAIGTGQVINARVKSINSRCHSTWRIGNGAFMPALPTIPDAPVNPTHFLRDCGSLTFSW